MEFLSHSDSLLTFEEAARVLAVSLRQLRRFVDSALIPVVRLSPRAPRIRVSDLQAFIAGRIEKQTNIEAT